MPAQTLDQLKAAFRGELIDTSHAAYDSARKVYNGMIDKRPQLIARCVDVADVIAAVKYGSDNKLLTAIRGGGHNGAGLGTCDDGLVIDLSRMKGIRVDPKAKTVRVEGGCVWGEVDHATHAFGMATPCGFISTTGVAGLTLGGGIGYLTRRYGLTIDNLLSADVVLADGSFVTASDKENSDLFWALRGGGGNFGVVTSFEFRLHPVDTVNFGPTFWPLEESGMVLKAFSEFIHTAPETVSGFFASHEEGLRNRLVLHRHGRRNRSCHEADTITRPSFARPRRTCTVPCRTEFVRRALRSGFAVVLARRQLHRTQR
jgi:FAD/FMN-containing dehydrogenase